MSNIENLKNILNGEIEIFIQNKSQNKILDRFNALKKEGQEQGFIPVIISELEYLYERFELGLEDGDFEIDAQGMKQYSDSILKNATAVNVKKWFEEKISELDLEESALEGGAEIDDEKMSAGEISSFLDYSTGNPKDEVIIVKIPTNKPYEIFAHLPIGGFNECPDEREMLAIAKYWYEQYGAIPVAITNDIVEFIVDKPPTEDAEVAQLAKEQYAFCPDIVDQGVESVEMLAKTLKGSHYWYFWWD